MSKRVLVVIDMQNDFVSGSLANKDAQAIVTNILSEIEKVDALIFTKDTHPSSYLSSQEGRKLPVEHCIENTWG
ncbi:MAG: isochorismatase family protein, partial [Bacteroidales bacterium]|nr:isochorismatase family protein [Bacteroidales bacterium]